MSTNPHPFVAFAHRYADPARNYLNAYIALARAEILVDDIRTMRRMLDSAEPPERRWAPWFGAEVISYYAVGLVTCLEWHARSRVVDLLTFDRGLKIEDFKGQVSDKLIVQMMIENAPISHLIGAAVNVSSAERYFAIIGQLFQQIGVPGRLTDWLTGVAEGATTCWVQDTSFPAIERLFEFRNELVHEIGSTIIGHPNIRDSWSPDQAAELAALVVSIIRGVESVVTRFAPPSFPNLLDVEGYPVSPLVSLNDELERRERIADSEIHEPNGMMRTLFRRGRQRGTPLMHMLQRKSISSNAPRCCTGDISTRGCPCD